jgi:hypothetical protein
MNNANLKTPESVARFIYRLSLGKAKPEIVEADYLRQAAELLADIPKAEKAKGGKYRGYTAEHLRRLADQNSAYAKPVADELRRLIAAA